MYETRIATGFKPSHTGEYCLKLQKRKHHNTWTSTVPSTYFSSCYINLSEDEIVCCVLIFFQGWFPPTQRSTVASLTETRNQHFRKGSYGQKPSLEWGYNDLISTETEIQKSTSGRGYAIMLLSQAGNLCHLHSIWILMVLSKICWRLRRHSCSYF